MAKARIEQIVRQFTENGLKLILEDPRNSRDLLHLIEMDVIDLIVFEQLTLEPTTFVERDYRHVESDLVLRALRRPKGSRGRKTLLIYILIEHQTEPDALMPLRVLEYVVQIYKSQVREWARTHRSLRGLRLQPVLPVVFYTGTRRWENLGKLADLIDLSEYFESVTPVFEPVFLNLREMLPDQLESKGGFFGWVLRLLQERHARPEEFTELLERVVRHLETMPAEERLRCQELLSYIQALVYHVRSESERPEMLATIEASVQTVEHRQEVSNMGKTGADALREEGELRARQRILLRQLRQRFGEVPLETVTKIESTKKPKQLDEWLDRILTTSSLDEMDIGPAK